MTTPGFVCALPRGLDRLSPDFRQRIIARAEASLAGRWEWVVEATTGALCGVVSAAGTPASSAPRIIAGERGILVGTARLDDSDGSADHRGDLARIAAEVGARGAEAVRGIVGDFAFVHWDAERRCAVAGRDAFGVRPLYVREVGDTAVMWSSTASALVDQEEYDPEYAVEFLLNGYHPGDRTPYAGVRTVPAGMMATMIGGALTVRPYWSVSEFQPAEDGAAEFADTAAVVEEWRRLFERAVMVRLGGRREVWSMLSGGLDSSSIVSMAETLARRGDAPHGLGGTVSFVDSYDDEAGHQRAVVDTYGLRYETIVDEWLWRDDGGDPPTLDEPHPLYGFYARNRRMCDAVRGAGGNVLLSGTGPDHYLAGNLLFFADMVAGGQWGRAIRELGHWAVLANKSFWRFAGEHAMTPLLPILVRRAFGRGVACTPSWFAPAFARQWSVNERTAWLRSNSAPRGRLYAGYIQFNMGHIPASIERGEYADGIEMRYPFLDRKLVEFSLRLPRALRTQPHARKWVQREAMRGVLPDPVRTRRSKGGIVGRTRWSLQREHRVVAELLQNPMLAQLGYVDRDQLSTAIGRAVAGDDLLLFEVVRVLSFEMWLRMKTGRWRSRGAVIGADREVLLPAC